MKAIVREYAQGLPHLPIVSADTLTRFHGPVVQGIYFDRLSYGAYRPTAYIRVLTASELSPGAMELPRFLKREKHESTWIVEERDHERERQSVLDAIREQVEPALTEPLDPASVLSLYETRAIPNAPQAYSLATLNAYLGHDERARQWIGRYRQLLPKDRSEWAEWDVQRDQFLQQLSHWLDQGIARPQLEHVVRNERRALGLPVE